MMSFDQFIFEVCEHPLISAGVVFLSWFFVRRFIRRLFRPRFPQTFTARVTYVCDGDSMWVKPRWGHRTKLRLIGMDAPETEQAFGRDATEVLTKKIGGTTVFVTAVGVDPYGRLISRVQLGKTDVSEFMIKEGLAWPYTRYFSRLSQNDVVRYTAAGDSARKARRGLWQETNPLPPWTWREQHRSWWSRFLFWFTRWIKRLTGG